jgi:alanyl-tRNA synthetase
MMFLYKDARVLPTIRFCIVVVKSFGGAYPELVKNQDTILEIIQEEEQSFSDMLDRGIKFFSDIEGELKAGGMTEVSGEKAFYLYDTLGFPIDLTERMAEEAGLVVDLDGFANEMEAQKTRSRAARNAARSGGAPQLEFIAEQTAWLTDNGVYPTDDSFKFKLDVELPGTVMAVFRVDGFLKDGAVATTGEFVGIVLDKTSFYAEAGGQEADTGVISVQNDAGETTATFVVNDVQSYGGFVLHTGVVDKGTIGVGSIARCSVDYERRRLVTPNHSMTHVLNAALRQVLGDGVDQRGSLCNDEKLRFDFSHKKAMSGEELKRVEEICQKVVADKLDVTDEIMPLAEAKKLDGVRAVFGEVYPDPVRVVKVGTDTSVEFCGGTHISNTAEAMQFVIVEETAVAKGIRRISAVTRSVAQKALEEGAKFATAVQDAESLNVVETLDLDKQAGALRKELDEAFMSAPLKTELRARLESLQKKAVDAKKAALAGRVDRVLEELKATIQESSARPFLVLNVDIGADAKAAQKVMNAVKSIAPSMAFLGISEEDSGSGGKVMAFSIVPDAMVECGFKADTWVNAALESCGGRGGGKANTAQGQAKECGNVEKLFADAEMFAETAIQQVPST